ncbi:M23 family metallopeptidase [Nitratidesulfovibrio sp. 1201_IL3209]|uniref:M23 family metallopeptidase n=1 Tax=Nitratidesulfovibrio sp. 1201_IL3209 TaxID=3084053 RepID=UPI002FD8A9B5
MTAAKNLSIVIVFAALLGLLGIGGFMLFQDMEGPEVILSPDTGRASPHQDLTLTLRDKKSGIRSVTVTVKKNSHSLVVLDSAFSDGRREQRVTFNLKDAGLKDGAFDLEVRATDTSLAGFGKGNTTTRIYPMRLDTQPPRVSVKSMPPYVRRGGTGSILYSVNEEVERTGVKVGDLYFPGFRQPSGDYICFFAFPHFLTVAQYAPEITAVDLSGNAMASRLVIRPLDKAFRHDNINLSESFLASKMPEFEQEVPGEMTQLERFLKVNSELRTANERTLLEVGKDTGPAMLWHGAFQQLPNSATRAGFADNRSYIYNGQKVDNQTHLGLDFASLAMAEVPASNSGRVVFAGQLGIYGNLVIVDHGLGLQTLYSHLSEISANVGQQVKKGDIIGKTGTTGMAGGDHLHFGVTVSGVQVQPVEWLDPHWIEDNVTSRLK